MQQPRSGETPARKDWREVIRATPAERVGQAVTMAAAEERRASMAAASPALTITRLNPQQQSSVAILIIAELQKEGLDRETIRARTPVAGLDPYRMAPAEIDGLTAWTRQSYPQALARVACSYHDQPDVLEVLLGERVLTAVVNSLAGEP